MATANEIARDRRNRPPNPTESKMHVLLDVMELDMSNKIDLVLENFLLLCHKLQPQEDGVIVISREQLELHKKLSMQRIQNKIDLEAYQHKQKMKQLTSETFSWLANIDCTSVDTHWFSYYYSYMQ